MLAQCDSSKRQCLARVKDSHKTLLHVMLCSRQSFNIMRRKLNLLNKIMETAHSYTMSKAIHELLNNENVAASHSLADIKGGFSMD